MREQRLQRELMMIAWRLSKQEQIQTITCTFFQRARERAEGGGAKSDQNSFPFRPMPLGHHQVSLESQCAPRPLADTTGVSNRAVIYSLIIRLKYCYERTERSLV
jgi:hypothetical protein